MPISTKYEWTPTNADITHIERMSKFWLPEKYIAEILGVSLHQYREARERDPRILKSETLGKALGAEKLYETAFHVAVNTRDVKMLQFILRAQEGWRDSDPAQIQIANFSGASMTNEEALKILEKHTKRQGDYNFKPRALEDGEVVSVIGLEVAPDGAVKEVDKDAV